MKRVYISGAIEHLDLAERKRAFMDAAYRIRKMGMVAVNPLENGLPACSHWRAHMRVDIGMLIQCDYIYMLDGWELSKGAKLELDVASSCGIVVVLECCGGF